MKVGSLFSGYLGLEMGVEQVLGGELAWVSDIDPGACKILAHRAPGVPNLGDITAVDWSRVEPVDVITGGSPCQDLSHAGKRGGMTTGTRSNLWVAMREAIAVLKPSICVWENVRGAYSASADSDVEPCPGCVGDRPTDVLRALGRVLGDLSDLGYDCRWHGLRAADVGAPHGRFRVFVVAHANRDGRGEGVAGGHAATLAGAACDRPVIADAGGIRRGQGRGAGRGEAQGWRPLGDAAGCGLLPTPRATRGGSNTETMSLLPTTQASDGDGGRKRSQEALRAGGTVEQHLARKPGRTVCTNLDLVAAQLLPTPSAGQGGSLRTESESDYADLGRAIGEVDRDQSWGVYADAIARWEQLTRPAPAPTMLSKKGTPQLSPAFSEWMMGLPAGWVTDVPGITRNEALRALGNGVVPQQAAAALVEMLSWSVAA